MADEKIDPALTAMLATVEAIKAALKAAPSADTEMKVVVGLLETATTFAMAFDIPPFVVALMFAEAMSSSEARVTSVRAKRAAQESAPVADAPVPVDEKLTEAQVAEILARLKEGGRVH